MVFRSTTQEGAEIAARYKVWDSIVKVSRQWRRLKRRHTTLCPEKTINSHAKLIITGSVNDTKKSECPSTSRNAK